MSERSWDAGSYQKVASVIRGDMSTMELPEKVDVVFSNAALHWVLDHDRAFAHFYALLRDGGELLIQCGGNGNLENAISILDRLKASENFAKYFSDWKQTWYFASAEETERLLARVGFKDIRVRLSKEPTGFANRAEFSAFVRAVILRPYLSVIPDEKVRDKFAGEFEDEVGHSGGWNLDYVRLSIIAKK